MRQAMHNSIKLKIEKYINGHVISKSFQLLTKEGVNKMRSNIIQCLNLLFY